MANFNAEHILWYLLAWHHSNLSTPVVTGPATTTSFVNVPYIFTSNLDPLSDSIQLGPVALASGCLSVHNFVNNLDGTGSCEVDFVAGPGVRNVTFILYDVTGTRHSNETREVITTVTAVVTNNFEITLDTNVTVPVIYWLFGPIFGISAHLNTDVIDAQLGPSSFGVTGMLGFINNLDGTGFAGVIYSMIPEPITTVSFVFEDDVHNWSAESELLFIDTGGTGFTPYCDLEPYLNLNYLVEVSDLAIGMGSHFCSSGTDFTNLGVVYGDVLEIISGNNKGNYVIGFVSGGLLGVYEEFWHSDPGFVTARIRKTVESPDLVITDWLTVPASSGTACIVNLPNMQVIGDDTAVNGTSVRVYYRSAFLTQEAYTGTPSALNKFQVQHATGKLYLHVGLAGFSIKTWYLKTIWDKYTNTNITDLVLDRYGLPVKYYKLYGHTKEHYFNGYPSDANFYTGFDSVPSTSITNLNGAVFDDSVKRLDATFTTNQTTLLNFDSYSIPVAASSPDYPIGTRIVSVFNITNIDPGSNIIFALWQNQDTPVVQVTKNGMIAAMVGRDLLNNAFLRVYSSGPVFQQVNLSVSPTDLLNKTLVLLVERTGPLSVKATLTGSFASDDGNSFRVDLTNILGEIEVTNPFVPVAEADRLTISTYVPDVVPSGTLAAHVLYLDVEVGTGTVLAVPSTGLGETDAKLRLYADKTRLFLTDGVSDKTVCSELYDPTIGLSSSCNDSILMVDNEHPDVIITNVVTDSTVYIMSECAIKVSYHPDFDDISIYFRSSKPGRYSVRVNSTTMYDGQEIVWGYLLLPDTVVAVDFATKISIVESGKYTWVKSGSGTNEYYLVSLVNENVGLPVKVIENDVDMGFDTIGSLGIGKWGFGDNDSLGFNTVYVRLSDQTNPRLKSDNYVKATLMGPPDGDYEITVYVESYTKVASLKKSGSFICMPPAPPAPALSGSIEQDPLVFEVAQILKTYP